MPKVSRNIYIFVALTALFFCAGIGCSFLQNSSSNSSLEAKSNWEACREAGKIFFSARLPDFIAFEYQTLAGDIYRHRRDYKKAQACYAESVGIAKKSFGEKSFFSYLAYECKAHVEQKAGNKREAYEDFKSALAFLPDNTAYDPYRWTTQRWVIALGGPTYKESVDFYLAHLTLAQKLSGGFVDHTQLISAIFAMAKALDARGAYDWSEMYWERMTTEVRAEHFAPTKLEPYLLNLAFHEFDARHWAEADKALAEALKIADEAHDDKMSANVLLKVGELRLKQKDSHGAELAFKKYLTISTKMNDLAGQSTAFGFLSEVARDRGDIAEREEQLKKSLQLLQTPTMRPRYLFTLACIAAQRKDFSKTIEYCNQWKQASSGVPSEQYYLASDELRELITLYPRLKEFGKQSAENGGCFFDAEEAAKILNVFRLQN